MTHALTTLDKLTNALRGLLRDSSLPDPIHVSFTLTSPELAVQVDHGRSHQAVADLLLWAYALHAVTAKWWRTSTGSLHITVWGRTTAGVPLRVYTGLSWCDCADLVQLAEEESEGVSLDELYRLAEGLRAREVAA